MDSETIDGFSGHSDRRQLINYIATLEPKPERIIIGHGEESKCLGPGIGAVQKFNVATRAPDEPRDHPDEVIRPRCWGWTFGVQSSDSGSRCKKG